MNSKTIFFYTLVTILFAATQLTAQSKTDNWPAWRGPDNNGVALNSSVPTAWNETQNVKWKTPIPGKGIGTPVVWEDQIFITTAIELDQKGTEEAIKRLKKNTPGIGKVLGMSETTEHLLQLVVYALNRNSGEIMWQKVVREQFPHEGIQSQNSWASASCATDGKHLIAHFGSFGTYCFNLKGELLWEKDLGDMQVAMAFGEGTSPVVHNNKVIVLWDHEGQSKIITLNIENGNEVWTKNRDEATTSVTPIVVNVEGKDQIIVPGKNKSIAYDFNTGEEIWELSGLKQDIIPCPVFDGENVYLMTGFPGSKKVLQKVKLK